MAGKKEPRWLNIAIILVTHRRLVSLFGGAHGVRDYNVLQSALASAQNHYAYQAPRPSIAQLAARYTFAINQVHAFVDGNKRIALAAGSIFLRRNGYKLNATSQSTYLVMIAICTHEISVEGLCQWFTDHIEKL